MRGLIPANKLFGDKQLRAPARVVILAFLALIVSAGVSAQIDTSLTSAYRFFDRPINPDQYLLRPGDQLRVTFIDAQVASIMLTLDPEARVVHSTIGLIDLSGKTLSQARTMLGDVLGRLYNVETIDIAVVEPLKVGIRVTGAVRSPGLYLAYTSQRVSEVIDSAGGVLPNGSHRRIQFTGGPQSVPVDLDRALYLGDEEANPSLYAGFTVRIPAKSNDLVNVVGEVQEPREIELAGDESVDDLIALAGGLRESADVTAITVIREADQHAAGEITPQAGDIVLVPMQDTAERNGSAILFGAVEKPGRYTVRGEMSLAALIDAAGGFRADAARRGVTVFRKATADIDGRREEIRYPISSFFAEDGSFLKFTLKAADSVFVPVEVGFVRVTGEVRNPGPYPFDPGRSAQDYINMAGGFLPTAKQDVVEVFSRVSGLTATQSPGADVHDGDEIRVLRREDLN